jgi:UDP-GlcNAc3NAcA epimerase
MKKKKLVTIIGARPQIIKSAALTKCILNHYHDRIEEIIIHTGQHYDTNLSDVFFKELGIPVPKYNLEIGQKSVGKKALGQMTSGISDILSTEKPDVLVIYGDTDSTLSGALAANKLGIPIAHIEAGLRSFDKAMPEEVNRVLSDHISSYLFCPTETAVFNLAKEGIRSQESLASDLNNPAVYHCGDIMYDNSLQFSKLAEEASKVLEENNLLPHRFVLITVHRAGNTDNQNRLESIFEGLVNLAKEESEYTFLLPIHPRTKAAIEARLSSALQEDISNYLKVISPVSFLDMIRLEQNCKMVITDSGGVQKEAFFFHKKSIILREETEWVEIVDCGKAALVDIDKKMLLKKFKEFSLKDNTEFPAIFGDGKASQFICDKLLL